MWLGLVFILWCTQTEGYDRIGLVHGIGEKTFPLITNITKLSYKITSEKEFVFDGHKTTINRIRTLLESTLFRESEIEEHLPTFRVRLTSQLDKSDYLIKKYYSLFYNLNDRKQDSGKHIELLKEKLTPGLEFDTARALYESLNVDKDSKLGSISSTANTPGRTDSTEKPLIEIGLDKRSTNAQGDSEQSNNKKVGQDIITDSKKKEKIISLAILLIQSVDNYNEELNHLINYIREVKNNQFSQNSIQHFRQLLNITKADSEILNIQTLNYKSNPDEILFDLQIAIQHDNEILITYLNIPIHGFSLNDSFYSNDLASDLFSMKCLNGICYKSRNTSCIHNLMKGTLAEIIQTCKFSKNRQQFDIVPDGIIIYSGNNKDINKLLEKLSLEVTSYPSLIRFKDCYNLTQHGATFTGCLELPRQIIPSLYSKEEINKYFDLDFWRLMINHFLDLPKTVTVVGIVAVNFSLIWATFCVFHFICKCCRNKKTTPKTATNINNLNRRRKQQRKKGY